MERPLALQLPLTDRKRREAEEVAVHRTVAEVGEKVRLDQEAEGPILMDQTEDLDTEL